MKNGTNILAKPIFDYVVSQFPEGSFRIIAKFAKLKSWHKKGQKLLTSKVTEAVINYQKNHF